LSKFQARISQLGLSSTDFWSPSTSVQRAAPEHAWKLRHWLRTQSRATDTARWLAATNF